MLMLVGNITKTLSHRWLLNPPFWHMFIRPRGIHHMSKWGSWLAELMGVMLSSLLCQNTGLNWYTKAQKSSLDWWCCLFVVRYCWMKSITLSCLLIFGPKRCMLCYLLVFSGHRCKKPVREFVGNGRFVNMLKITHKHPQVYWNLYPFLSEGLDLGPWILSLGCLLV